MLSFSLMAQKASLSGKILDTMNNQPLPFVNVVVLGTSIGTVTDEEGHFKFESINSGYVRIEASFVGYKKYISAEIEASIATTRFIEIKMEMAESGIEEVRVTASPYRKTMESLVSLRSIGIGEIEKAPGANLDYSQLNTHRFDPFHQLDLRIDKSYYWNKLTAKFYIDIQNLYNFQAQQSDIIVRAEDANGDFILVDNGTRYVLYEVESTSGTVLPTIGIIVQF